MFEAIPNPLAYGLAVVCFGGWLLLAYMVRLMFTGKLRTESELQAMERRAATAEGSLRVRDEQVNAALAVLPQIAGVLEKFHLAGNQVRQEREGAP